MIKTIDGKSVIGGLEYCTTHYNCREPNGDVCPYIDNCSPIKDATGKTLDRDALRLIRNLELYNAILRASHKYLIHLVDEEKAEKATKELIKIAEEKTEELKND